MQNTKNNHVDIEALIAFANAAKKTGHSPLWDFVDEIDMLRGLGASQVRIVEWLALAPRNLTTTRSDLSIWLKRRARRADKSEEYKRAGTMDMFEPQTEATQLDSRIPSLSRTASDVPSETPVVNIPKSTPRPGNDLVHSSKRDRDDPTDTPLARKFADLSRSVERSASIQLPPKNKAMKHQQSSSTKDGD
jgi:hypothetical protein